MANIFRVLLLIESSRRSGRELIRGVLNYANLHGPWTFYREPPFYRQSDSSILDYINKVKPNGIIARDTSKSGSILELNLPVILSASYRKSVPAKHTISCDNRQVAKMAIEHFLERGFNNFAFCGYGNYCWSRERQSHFISLLHDTGRQAAAFNIRPHAKSKRASIEKKLVNWLNSLPKPLAMLTCNDECASEVIDACRIADIDVPDSIAVVSVDNDEMICELTSPKISSISLNNEQCGYNTARMLHNMMLGKKVPPTQIITAPLSLVTRESSDILAISDQQVSLAVQYIRQNHHRLLQVQDVLDCEKITISRRALERRFRRALGHSIYKEIIKNRVEEVCKMLTGTNLSITEIARKLGYSNVDHVARWFRRDKGMSLREFRKKCGREN